MNPQSPFELLSIASALFPKQLSGNSETDQLDALRKTTLLFERAQEILDQPDADIWQAAQDADEKAERVLRFDAPELLELSRTKKDKIDTASEAAKQVHRKAARRAKTLGLRCPSLAEGITWVFAERLFSAQIKPGRRPGQKQAGT